MFYVNKGRFFDMMYCKHICLEAVVRRCSSKQVFSEISQISLENTCAGVFLIKLQACNFIQKKLQQRCFPAKFAKLLRTPFFIEHLRWLLLSVRIKEERVIGSMYIKYICCRHEQKTFSGRFAPNSQPGPYLGPTGGITAPQDPSCIQQCYALIQAFI